MPDWNIWIQDHPEAAGRWFLLATFCALALVNLLWRREADYLEGVAAAAGLAGARSEGVALSGFMDHVVEGVYRGRRARVAFRDDPGRLNGSGCLYKIWMERGSPGAGLTLVRADSAWRALTAIGSTPRLPSPAPLADFAAYGPPGAERPLQALAEGFASALRAGAFDRLDFREGSCELRLVVGVSVGADGLRGWLELARGLADV